MRLELTDPRQALIVRCQAWAYANVVQGKYDKAQTIFERRLAAFDQTAESLPTDSLGYWAGHYYVSFMQACENLMLNKV